GFEVEQISAKELDDVSVSSTKIRRALQNGDVALATAYLGYDYPLTGTVVEGRKLGRTLVYPTANIRIPENYKLIPKDGVYVVKSTIDGRQIGGMMNIGINPTIEDANRSIEIYFIDFDADLYGRELQVSLLHRLRDEQKFESLDLLKQQLAEDELQSRAFLNSVL